MKERNLDLIEIPEHGLKPLDKDRKFRNRKVYGFDTETYKGKVTLLCCYGDGFEDQLVVKNVDQVLYFLTRSKFKNSHNFFFNLKFDMQAIVKWLPDQQINHLINYHACFYNQFIIKLIGDKGMIIQRLCLDGTNNKIYFKFVDVSPFYNLGSLMNTVEKGLNEKYIKRLDIQKGVLFNDHGCFMHTHDDTYEEVDRSEIIKYCIEDCYWTYKLGKNIVNLTHEMDIPVFSFYSPASISKGYLRKTHPEGYKFDKTRIAKGSLYSYAGGRFETMIRGVFGDIHSMVKLKKGEIKDESFLHGNGEKVYMCDINSAYPYHISKLYKPEGLHLNRAEYRPEAIYSSFKVDIESRNEYYMSPLKAHLKSEANLLVFPEGKLKDVWINKSEMDLLVEEDFKIDIKKGFHILNKDPKPWLGKEILDAYKLRQKYKKKGDRREMIIKLYLNSLYGCQIELVAIKEFIEELKGIDLDDPELELVDIETAFGNQTFKVNRRWRAGTWFNPMLASEITSRTRNQIFRDFRDKDEDIIQIATDSIAMRSKLPVKDSNELGGYEHYGEMVGFVSGNGIYRYETKDKIIQKKRGLISNDQVDLYNMFKDCDKDSISLTKTRPKSLRESLQFDTQNPNELINVWVDFKKDLGLNMDKKRIWDRKFNTFNDILEDQIESVPLYF